MSMCGWVCGWVTLSDSQLPHLQNFLELVAFKWVWNVRRNVLVKKGALQQEWEHKADMTVVNDQVYFYVSAEAEAQIPFAFPGFGFPLVSSRPAQVSCPPLQSWGGRAGVPLWPPPHHCQREDEPASNPVCFARIWISSRLLQLPSPLPSVYKSSFSEITISWKIRYQGESFGTKYPNLKKCWAKRFQQSVQFIIYHSGQRTQTKSQAVAAKQSSGRKIIYKITVDLFFRVRLPHLAGCWCAMIVTI